MTQKVTASQFLKSRGEAKDPDGIGWSDHREIGWSKTRRPMLSRICAGTVHINTTNTDGPMIRSTDLPI